MVIYADRDAITVGGKGVFTREGSRDPFSSCKFILYFTIIIKNHQKTIIFKKNDFQLFILITKLWLNDMSVLNISLNTTILIVIFMITFLFLCTLFSTSRLILSFIDNMWCVKNIDKNAYLKWTAIQRRAQTIFHKQKTKNW